MGKTLTLSPADHAEIGRRLGVPPRQALAELLRLADKYPRRPREYAEDPTGTGILKLSGRVVEYTPTAERNMSEADDPVEVELDAAVAAGRIDPGERETWRRRFRELADFEFARETLNALPADPDRGARAFESDRRLRAFSDAFEDYLGIPEENRGGGRDFAEHQRPPSLGDAWMRYCGLSEA